ncbi:lipopolysaccharide core heptose(II) kinase RfaY [Marinobacter bohaiensis]|uniref:lipopolysaccharide core heptose(II) kinase RfaY n=1 Tax=Marinobacter bohaiensis TaxID=2201898 RepID=UPI000DAE3C70|nr:lipopolysaccharide core heptose(II) kinase RfaY [Marinobacter bohaiensis]
MSLSFDHGEYRVVSRLNEAQSGRLVEAVVAGDVDRETVFRDNWRTLSARVRFENQSLLLKVPRARNGRRWERFLTRFRGSDAVRTFRHLERMAAMGFSAPEPVLACEQRQGGAVVDSFVCYRFVDGRPARPEDAPKVIAALQALHQKGYLRSDAQMANFIVNGERITFIDFRLKKPRFLPALQKARELDRFLRSCPEARRSLDPSLASSGWLRLATRLEDARFALRNLKRRLRKR